ncbi:unnamed protein product [Blepharisma stoltei]|uniref:Centrosomal protein of 70 kDa n=1 Tax=Blepharisma stoltei TaxID=1481888 RepID=A0AAU9JC93_9CILI|nr:unnamed protein product [Blepharisma stoltei]
MADSHRSQSSKRAVSKGAFSNLHYSQKDLKDSSNTHRRASPIYSSDPNTSLLEHLKTAEISKSLFEKPINDFLKESNEIQEEIKILTEMCRSQIQTTEDWDYINELLLKNDFDAIFINSYGTPDIKSIIDAILALISEYEKLKSQNYNEKTPRSSMRASSPIPESSSTPRNRSKKDDYFRVFWNVLHKDYDNSSPYDQSVLSYISQSEEHKLIYEGKLTSYQDQISFLKSRLKEVDQRNYFSSPESYESPYKESTIGLKEIASALGVDSIDEILSAIEQMNKVLKVVPNLERFIEDVCQELLPSTVKEQTYESYSKAFEEVIPTIKELKSLIDHLHNFKQKVYSSLKLQLNTPESVVLDSIKAIRYFEKLFEVKMGDDLLGVMEQLFLFVHEMRLFVQNMKNALGLDKSEPVGKVLEAIKKIIVK